MRAHLELPRLLVPSLADDIGISPARVRTEVRRGNWRMIARGAVLTRPEQPTRADWAALGIALGGPTAALTGWDALRIRGLVTSAPPTDQVLVLSRRASNRVIGHVRIRETARAYRARLTPADALDYPLTPAVGAARAVSDASRYYRSLPPVRGVVTTAIQRQACSLEDLVAELRAGPRGGSRFLRLALGDAVDGARSEAEAAAARRMTRAAIPAFELNVPIVDERGDVIAVADALWRDLRAVLEVDSREYHFSELEWKRTMARHNRLTRRGFAVSHYPPSVVSGRNRAWLAEVRDWLYDRAHELGIAVPRQRGVLRPADGVPVPFVLAGRAA